MARAKRSGASSCASPGKARAADRHPQVEFRRAQAIPPRHLGAVAVALVADQGDRLPLRQLASRRAAATTRRSSSSTTGWRSAAASTCRPTAGTRRDHIDDDPHRISPNGKPYGPWHDATMLMQGDVAERSASSAASGGSSPTRAELETDRAARPGMALPSLAADVRERRHRASPAPAPPTTSSPRCARSRRSTST